MRTRPLWPLLAAGLALGPGCGKKKEAAPAGKLLPRPTWFSSSVGRQMEPLELKVREWRGDLNRMQAIFKKLEKDREEVLHRLRTRAKVHTTADLRKNDLGQLYAREYGKIVRQEAAVEKRCRLHELVIETAEVKLRELERAVRLKDVADLAEDTQISRLIPEWERKLEGRDEARARVDEFKVEERLKKDLERKR